MWSGMSSPYPGQGFGARWFLRFIPTPQCSMILWFCDLPAWADMFRISHWAYVFIIYLFYIPLVTKTPQKSPEADSNGDTKSTNKTGFPQHHSKLIPFLLWLDFLVCVFTGFVTSKHLATLNHNKKLKSATFPRSLLLTAFKSKINSPGQDKESMVYSLKLWSSKNTEERANTPWLVQPFPPRYPWIREQLLSTTPFLFHPGWELMKRYGPAAFQLDVPADFLMPKLSYQRG